MALLPLTKLGRDVFAPVTAGGAPRGAVMDEAAVLTTEYEALLKALIAGIGGSITLLPEIVYAQNSGAGTANAVKATTAVTLLSSAPGAQLITVNFVAPNGPGGMTLQINNGTVRDLVTNTGDPVPENYTRAGMAAMVQIDANDDYRLFSYGDAAAIQAAAEAALALAEAARDAALGAMTVVLDPQFSTKAFVEANYHPPVATLYIRTAGDATTGDTGAALYKKVVSEPAHAGKLSITLDDGVTVVWYELADNIPPAGALGLLPGNTESANAAALLDLETVPRDVFDLGGDVSLPAGTYPSRLLVGNGTKFIGGEPAPFNVPGQTARDYIPTGKTGDLKTFLDAVKSGGPVRVALWGDSITEGISQIDYEDSWAGLFETRLRNMFPAVEWVFGNFSIAGRGVGEANSDTYVGAANSGSVTPGVNFWAVDGKFRTPPNPSLWPGGTTPGLSWHGHVEAFDPHLTIIALGINLPADGPTNTYDTMTVFGNLLLRPGAWTGKSSVALVTPILPTRKTGMGVSPWQAVQAVADGMRSMACDPAYPANPTLLDANARWRSLLDGVDVTSTRKRVIVGFPDYADWTTLSGTRPAESGGVLTFSAASGWVNRREIPVASDGDWSFTVTLGSSTSIVDLSYRADPANLSTSYLARVGNFTGSPFFFWYYGATVIQSSALTPAASYRVRVRLRGARHEIWVNDVKIIDKADYRWVKPGVHGFAGYGAATVSSFYSRLGYPARVGYPLFLEKHLLGVNDFGANQWSLGGHPANHPSILGHREGIFAACGPLFDALETVAGQIAPGSAQRSASSTAIDMTSATYIDVRVVEVAVGTSTSEPGLVIGSAAASGIGATAEVTRVIKNVDICSVQLAKDNTVLINESFDLPYKANWRITVFGRAITRTSVGHRASILAIATEVQ